MNQASYALPLLLLLALSPGPMVGGIDVHVVKDTATITWDTNEPATSRVDYGLTIAYGASETSAALVTSHSLVLSNLAPGSTYHFKVTSADAAGNKSEKAGFTFKTSQAPDTTPPVITNVKSEVNAPPVDPDPPAGDAFYVSTSGNDSANGTTPATAWRTIGKAAATAIAGDTVYVKAGNYGNESVTFPRSGTATKPITIEGYRTTPGDNPQPTYKVGDASLNAALMPTLSGNRSKSAFTLSARDYVHIKNIQIQLYTHGINLQASDHNAFENVTAINLGSLGTNYSGKGIIVRGDSNTVTNCTVADAGAEALMLYGSNNTMDGCKAYGVTNNTGDGTDYYITVIASPGAAAATGNVVKNCFAQRVSDTIPHGGHGIGTKGSTTNNTFTDCEAIGFSGYHFVVRHSGSANNTFLRCVARGQGRGASSALAIRDGAHDNLFMNCEGIGMVNCISGQSTTEDGSKGIGKDNRIVNCTFSFTGAVVFLSRWSGETTGAFTDNDFVNCNFVGNSAQYLSKTLQPSSGNQFVNCILTGMTSLRTGTHPATFSYTNSLFWGNGFSTPSGTANLTADPKFVSATDWHLQATSPCIDAGTATGAPAQDIEGTARPQGTQADIGAFERVQ